MSTQTIVSLATLYVVIMFWTFILLVQNSAKRAYKREGEAFPIFILSLLWPFTLLMWLIDEFYDYLYKLFQE